MLSSGHTYAEYEHHIPPIGNVTVTKMTAILLLLLLL